MKIEITGLNHTGEGIGKIKNKIIFIQKTIPGDIVIPTDVIDHGNYNTATMKSLYQKSPKRVDILCPYYNKCGGCQLLGLSYQDQLAYKQETVKNILKKYATIEVNPKIIPSPPYHYRNKIILQVQNGQIGLYEHNSRKLVPIKQCLLISSKMNEQLQLIQQTINLTGITQIMIREAGEQIMIQFLGQAKPAAIKKLLSPQITSLYLNDDLIAGKPQIEEQLGEYHFLISPYSFFQVNHSKTINLYDQVKKYLGTNHNHVLDLYCGTGTIGIYVSKYCKKITGIEINPSAVKDAQANIKNNSLSNIKVKQGQVGSILKNTEKYDAIIVDPPRSGLDKKTKRTLLQIKCPKMIYISCNAITLARDLNQLKELYILKDITLFDMFPNTSHVECISLLELKEK